MERRISYQQFQSVKAVAKAIDPILNKKKSVAQKIEALIKEQENYDAQVQALEAGIVSIIGFHVTELVKKVIEPTGKTDKEGRPIKETKYLPTSIVSYDNNSKEYVISLPDPEPQPECPVYEQ